jgi:hypothetical protein
LGNPLICKFAGVDIPLNVPLSVRKRIRRAAAVGNPVAAAQFYQAMINTFIKTLLRPVNASGDGGNGILGITDSYFGTVEASGRGALHFHCLVWSQGNIGIEDIYHQLKTDVQYQERVLSFLDQVTIESIDMANTAEPNFLEKSINFEAETTQFMGELRVDSNMVAGKVNMHRCTFSCRKYQTGEQACRFGAPWELQDESHVQGSEGIQMRRNHEWINCWNPVLASCMRCNHDISFIAGRRNFLGLIYYITDYATKLAKPLYHYYSLAATLMPSNGEQGKSREAEQMEESRRFMTRLFNRIGVAREISGPEIANVMIGGGESFTNARFVSMNYNSLHIEMKKRYPQFNCKEHPEETQEEPENSILRIHNQGMALDMFSDYRHRGEMLKEVCLYDYKTFVYCKGVPEGHEESYAPFDKSYEGRQGRGQFIHKSRRDCRVLSFSGSRPQARNESEDAEER